jgi:Deoxynucleotide monophosphate kinase
LIIGLTGLAQSGKDTAAQYLIDNYDFTRLAFADKLKELGYLINPELREAVDVVGWEAAKKIPVFRRFLQDLGHNARVVFGDDFWVDQVLPRYDEFAEEHGNVVFTDMRYPNEFERINWHGGWTVRINRPGVQAPNNHITETAHLGISTTFEIVNETFDGLYNQLDAIVQEIKGA